MLDKLVNVEFLPKQIDTFLKTFELDKGDWIPCVILWSLDIYDVEDIAKLIGYNGNNDDEEHLFNLLEKEVNEVLFSYSDNYYFTVRRDNHHVFIYIEMA